MVTDHRQLLLKSGMVHPQESSEEQTQVERDVLGLVEMECDPRLLVTEDSLLHLSAHTARDFGVVAGPRQLEDARPVCFRFETAMRGGLTMHP